MKWYLGVDNGVTGQICLISDDSMVILKSMPVFKCLNYTKKKAWLNRVNGIELRNFLQDIAPHISICLIERPMVNPGRWMATMSAIRCLEATLIVLEILKIPFRFIDSKKWQKLLLPAGLRKEELKEASLQIGKRLYPNLELSSFKDADGLLIAHYAKVIGGN